MILEIKNFQFIPSSLRLSLQDDLIIRIGKNKSNSGIYHQDRYFIFSIIPCINLQPNYDEEIETPSLSENEEYRHIFLQEGEYLIQCINSIPFKAMITVKNQPSLKEIIISKENKQIVKRIDPFAPQNREQKLFGQQTGPLMDPINIITYLKDNDKNIDTIIDPFNMEQIEKNLIKNNSCLDTISTFNSSFQQQVSKIDTYSEKGECQLQSFLDRKHSDPLVIRQRELSPIQTTNLTWQERVINTIKAKDRNIQFNCTELAKQHRYSKLVTYYFEQEFSIKLK